MPGDICGAQLLLRISGVVLSIRDVVLAGLVDTVGWLVEHPSSDKRTQILAAK